MESTEATFARTRSNREFHEKQRLLTELATSGELTRELLDEAMAAMYDDGDYIEQSIGYAWLSENPNMFSQVAGTLGFDVADFFMEHSGLCWVGDRIVLNTKLLSLVPAERREQFVRDLYMQCGAHNDSWIAKVTAIGVPVSSVQELILAKLERTPDNCDGSHMVHAVYDFLRYGYRPNDKTGMTPWQVLTPEQFTQALEICARKSPYEFFRARREIEQYLGLENASTFRDLGWEVIQQLDRLTREQQHFVDQLPFARRLEVVNNLNAGSEFLLQVILKLEQEAGKRLYQKKSAVFDAESIAKLYATTWALRHEDDGKARAPWLESELKQRLHEAGYIIGTVKEGRFRGNPQMEVRDYKAKRRYVQERRQMDYRPQVGDTVLIQPAAARPLNSWTSAAVFQPVKKATS